MIKSTAEVRQAFLDFFASKQHQIVKSSSLVPGNDATLLFTNAGMVPFKDVFLGAEKRSYTRATSAQRCVRAGGKHNDLENVGYTARHHTFLKCWVILALAITLRKCNKLRLGIFNRCFRTTKEKLLVTIYESDEEAFYIGKM